MSILQWPNTGGSGGGGVDEITIGTTSVIGGSLWEVLYIGTGDVVETDSEFLRNQLTGEFTAQRTSAAFTTQGFYLTDVGGTTPSALMESLTATTRASLWVDNTGLVTGRAEAIASGAYTQIQLGNIFQATSDSNVGLSATFQVSQNAVWGGSSTDGTNTAAATFAAQSLNTISFTNGTATSSITQDASSTVMGFTDGASFSNTFISGVDGASITEYSLFTSAGLTLLDYQSSATTQNAYLFSNLPTSPTTATGNIFIASNNTVLTSGSFNSIGGWLSGDAITEAQMVTAWGYNAASAITTNQGGSEQLVTAIGFNALAAATHYRNTAVGARAAELLTGVSAYANVFLGDECGKAMLTGYHNLIAGGEAAKVSTGMADCVVLGYGAGLVNTGSNQLFAGANAGYTNEDGTNLILLGYLCDVQSPTGINDSLGIGIATLVYESNTAVFGEENHWYEHIYFGQGRQSGLSNIPGSYIHGTSAGVTGTGSNDGPGAFLKITGGPSCGNGIPGDTGFMTSRKSTLIAADDENILGDRLWVMGDYFSVMDNTDTHFATVTVADTGNGMAVGGTIYYTARCNDGAGAWEIYHNVAHFTIVNVSGTITTQLQVSVTPAIEGTITAVLTLVDNGLGAANFSIQVDSSLDEPSLINAQIVINFGEALVTSL